MPLGAGAYLSGPPFGRMGAAVHSTSHWCPQARQRMPSRIVSTLPSVVPAMYGNPSMAAHTGQATGNCRGGRCCSLTVRDEVDDSHDFSAVRPPHRNVPTRPDPARPLQNITVGMTTLGRSIWRHGTAEHERVSKRVEAVAKALGKRIRQLRSHRGWSQEYLAEEAGTHRTYLWGIEQGVRNPSIRHLTQIADALGVSVGSLFAAE